MARKRGPLKPRREQLPKLEDMSAILAHLIIGINPYLDISTLHVMLTDVLMKPMDEEDAWKAGIEIGKRARISITSDAPGGLQ